MKGGAPENFVGHPVADSGKLFLHEQDGLDRSPASAFQKRRYGFDLELRGKDGRRNGGPPRGSVRTDGKLHPAEHPRIIEDQRAFLLPEHQVIVFAGLETRRFDAQLAAHAEVKSEPGVATEMEKHLLGRGG